MTLSNGNKLADFVDLNLIGLRVVAFEEMSKICRLYKNEVALQMEAIWRIM